MRVRAVIALAVVGLVASHLTATSDRPAPRPRPSERDVAATPAPTRTPVPPKLGRDVIDRQDRTTPRERERESEVFDGRPLLTQLPLELAGVRIDIAGLAADRETTLLSIDQGTRSRAHARAIYEQALAGYRDSGHAYERVGATSRQPAVWKRGRHAVTRRAISVCYLALWLATAAGAALASAGLHLVVARAPRDALEPSLETASGLLAHNALVALWPLALVAIGWPALAGARLAGDALIAAQLFSHGLIVGSAVGQQPATWRYLPHLPLEWLALAIPAAAWLTARAHPAHRAGTTVAVAVAAGACVAALLGAAAIETYLVPVT